MGRIITEKTAQKWIKEGRAEETGIINHNGVKWMAMIDYKKQETVHYKIKEN